MIKSVIQDQLKKILQELQISDIEPVIERTSDMSHGDYATNVAFQIKNQSASWRTKIKITDKNSKLLGLSNPREIAEEIIKKWSVVSSQPRLNRGQLSVVEKVEVAGLGFINFWISKEELSSKLSKLLSEGEKIIKSTKLDGIRIMVEYAHPNTHKALHIGHLRNLSIGESLVRLLESQGAQVIRANYQGDVGMHIAKAIYGLLDLSPFKDQLSSISGIQERVDFLGKAYAAGSQIYESDPQAKEKIHDFNFLVYASAQRFQQEKGIPAGTTDYLQFVKGRKEEVDKVYEVWKETRQWSLDYYEMMYKRLDTHFDRYYFESECLSGVDMAREAVKRGVLKESNGAIIFDGEPYGLDTRVFVNSLGLPTYEAKELSLSKKELSEYSTLDKIIHVVGPEQASFFQITFKVEELLGIQNDQQYHLVYGWVRLKQGKMSSRLGNVITAEQLVNEVKKSIAEILDKSETKSPDEHTAEDIAVGAIKYSFLKVSTTQEIAFDLQESVSAEGNSGPYLQYTYARTQSVLRKAGMSNVKSMENGKWKMENEELTLLRLLYFFVETVTEAAEKYSPNILANYLYILAQQFNLFYQKHSILNPVILIRQLAEKDLNSDSSPDLNRDQNDNSVADVKAFRMALTTATGNVIKQGLHLLGIQAPEKM